MSAAEQFEFAASEDLRRQALALPEVTEGASCVNRAFKAGGKSFAFVNPASSGGYYYPRMKLRAAGLNPDKHFGKTSFAGSHTAVAEPVDVAIPWLSKSNQGRGRLRRYTKHYPPDRKSTSH